LYFKKKSYGNLFTDFLFYDIIFISNDINYITNGVSMLEALFGTKNRELALQYLIVFEEGYAREIAKYFDVSLPSIQNQLNHFEKNGLALSKMVGRTKVYFLNPRYAFLEEVIALLDKARPYYKPELKKKFEMQRKRPRRPGKPL
jgi:predicted transcriptional regulator